MSDQVQNYMTRSGRVRIEGDPDPEQQTFEFVISDETPDRHGTVLKMSGWDLGDYEKNPIVAYQHEVHAGFFSDRTDPDQVIGTSQVFVENDQLIGRVTFEPADINPLADKIRRKIIHGTLRTASVGFNPTSGHWGNERNGENPDLFYFDGQSLLEWSVVNIPSNPNAVKRNMEVLNRFDPDHFKPEKTSTEPGDQHIESNENQLEPTNAVRRIAARHYVNKRKIKSKN